MQVGLGRTQRAIFHVVERAQRAAEAVLHQREGGLGEHQGQLLFAGQVLLDPQLAGGGTGHQRLTVGQGHGQRTVGDFLHADTGVLAEVLIRFSR